MKPDFVTKFKARQGHMVAFFSKSYPAISLSASVGVVRSVGQQMLLNLTTFNQVEEHMGGRPLGYPMGVYPGDARDLSSTQLSSSGTWVPLDFYHAWQDECEKVDPKTQKKNLMSFDKFFELWLKRQEPKAPVQTENPGEKTK